MNKNKKNFYFILFLLVTALTAVTFYLQVKKLSSSRSQTREELNIENPATKRLHEIAEQANQPKQNATRENQSDHIFINEFKKCFSDFSLGNIDNPKKLVQSLKETNHLNSTDFQIENYHLDLPNGEEKRLQIISSDKTQSSSKKEIRMFKLDSEGLPQPIRLTKEQKLNSDQKTITQLLSQGKIKFHQLKEVYHYDNGLVADIEWINDDTRDVQFIWQNKVLSCRQNSCECRL